jgi:hypothetical protein
MFIRRPTLLWPLLLLAACSKPLPPEFGNIEALDVPLTGSGVGARMTTGANGTVLLSWMERHEDGANLMVSEFSEGRWQPAKTIVTDSGMFVNWADLPSVTVLGRKHWVAHWLSQSAAEWYAYDIKVAQSFDEGASWSEPLSPHSDGSASEHGFVSVFSHAGDTGMLWLDGRKTVNKVPDNPFESGTELRTARIGLDGTLGHEQVLDELVCDCCQTDVAVAREGPIAVYRDRSADEIRDIYLTRFQDGEWQPPTSVANDGWQISGCPVNGPAIAASGDYVGVAWFTAAAARPLIKASFSKDGGRSFGQPILISDGIPSGHVDIVYTGDSGFVVSWLGSTTNDHAINLRSVTAAGLLGDKSTIARSPLAQNVPQMEAVGDALLLAWMDRTGDDSHIVSVIAQPQK